MIVDRKCPVNTENVKINFVQFTAENWKNLPMWKGFAIFGELNSTIMFSGMSLHLILSEFLNPSRTSLSWLSSNETSDAFDVTFWISSWSTSLSCRQSIFAFLSCRCRPNIIFNSFCPILLRFNSKSPGSEIFTGDNSFICKKLFFDYNFNKFEDSDSLSNKSNFSIELTLSLNR